MGDLFFIIYFYIFLISKEISADSACNASDPDTFIRRHHHSWNDKESNQDSAQSIIDRFHSLQEEPLEVPVYDLSDNTFDPNLKATQQKIYNSFFNEVGALIVRGAYSNQTMSSYNKWCEDLLRNGCVDANCRHPKQSKKYLINDVMGRLGKDDPDLLMKLVNNKYFTLFNDILLGFMKFGSVTTHWIEAGGDRQTSHVDYPIHVGSGPFWEHDVNKLMQLTTKQQLNDILPYFSVQVLVASDRMNVQNGATELIPGSHLIQNIDILVHDKQIYDILEPHFISVDLQQGDFLIFNRRLVHRGGANLSDQRRNSLILQCVWLWGIGQEIMEYDELMESLKDSQEFNNLNEREKEIFSIRLKPPYPANIKLKT